MTIRLFLYGFQQFPERRLDQQRCSYDSEYVEGAAVQPEVVFNDGHQAVRNDGGINLDADGVFCRSPKGIDLEVLLYPFEEQFHQPAILIQESDGFRREGKIVGNINKGPVLFSGEIHDSAENGRIVSLCLLPSQPYRLVKEDVPVVGQFISRGADVVPHFPFLPDNEESIVEMDGIKPLEVVIPTIENIVGERDVLNQIHHIDVGELRLRDMNEHRYLRGHIQHGVCLYSALRLPKVSPREQAQAEIYGRGIHGEELAVQIERPVQAPSLCDSHHVISKLLKDSVVPMGIGGGKVSYAEFGAPEPQVESFLPVRVCDATEFPETATTSELSVHDNHQLVPATEIFDIPVSAVFLYNAVEYPLWKKVRYLAEDIGSRIHYRPFGNRSAIIRIQIDTQKSTA